MDFTARDKRQPLRLEKSRNQSIVKSSTVLMLNKHVKSSTPLRSSNAQRSSRAEPSVTPREKALAKQNLELKKENAELIRLLKRSKELIRDEINKYAAENITMKHFLEMSWSLTEGKVDEKLREQVRSMIGIRVNTLNATNNTEHVSAELPASVQPDSEELESLRRQLTAKEAQNKTLVRQMHAVHQESRAMAKYLSFTLQKRSPVPRFARRVDEVLPVDSANVGSDDEDEEKEAPRSQGTEAGKQVPGFIKSLMLVKE